MSAETADPVVVETPRLLLRGWRRSDREPFARLNADPRVMEHFPSALSREESDGFADRIDRHLRQEGWGLWAVEERGGEPFIGFVGLWPVGFDLTTGAPAVEVGWRLRVSAWGKGYATEGARAALRVAWTLPLPEVLSFTSRTNTRSVAVMERLGMRFDREFDHPRLPPGHPLRPHVLYRIGRPEPVENLPATESARPGPD